MNFYTFRKSFWKPQSYAQGFTFSLPNTFLFIYPPQKEKKQSTIVLKLQRLLGLHFLSEFMSPFSHILIFLITEYCLFLSPFKCYTQLFNT